MAPASQRTRFRGPVPVTAPTLVHLLARLGEADGVTTAPPVFAERLGQWLHWTDAAALAAALDGPATQAETTASADETDLARLRAELTEAIAEQVADFAAAPDVPPLRRSWLPLQQSMATRITALRGRLRATLAARSAPLARLAALDEVMEGVLGRQEQGLLGSLPGRLQRRLDGLRTESADAAWRPAFRDDLQAVLLAELALRLQPLDGLVSALRSSAAAPQNPNSP